MELLQLKYFCEAASSESFSATAKKFNVPPSDISQSIRRLEGELGVKLFSRSANKIFLNEKGRDLYGCVSRALGIIADGISAVTEKENGRINVCVNSNRRIVMNVVEAMRKSNPEIMVTAKFFSDPTSEEFDIIVSSNDERLTSYDCKRILREPVAIAVRRDSHLSSVSELSAFSQEPFITMNETSSLYILTMTVCSDFGFTPRIAVQSDDPYYVRRCVELGLGCAIVPEITWRGQFPESVILKRLDGYYRDTFLYTDKNKYITANTQKFIERLVSECEREGDNVQ